MPKGIAGRPSCTIDGCDDQLYGRGMCNKHYRRWRRGTPLDGIRRSAVERFWSFIERRDDTTCWLWRGTCNPAGYGTFWHDGKYKSAHRYAYELLVEPIPEGLEIDHVRARGCTHLNCVNPSHLEPVTPAENKRRSTNPAGENARKTECVNGHPLTPDNVYVPPSAPTERQCRICLKAKKQRQRARAS